MPLFFFDIYDDDQIELDQIGLELEGLEEARKQADALLPEIVREENASNKCRALRVVVRSLDGHRLYQAALTLSSGWLDRPGSDDSQLTDERP